MFLDTSLGEISMMHLLHNLFYITDTYLNPYYYYYFACQSTSYLQNFVPKEFLISRIEKETHLRFFMLFMDVVSIIFL